MRLHRFYIKESIVENKISIKNIDLIHQLKKVFRYKIGDKIIIFDSSSYDFECLIDKLDNSEVVLSILSKNKGILSKLNITLFQSLIKKDKMEWVVQKATELGVSKIVPVISERSEKKDLNVNRLQKIIIEASEQSGRSDLPIISEILNLEDSAKEVYGAIVLDKSGEDFSNYKNVENKEVKVFVGPEGGFTETEINLFKKEGAKIFNLGSLTLRSETASIAVLANLAIKS